MESEKVASGGTVKRVGLSSRLVHTFTESGDFVVHRPVIIRYLIVGGRGGGPAPDNKSKIDQEGGIGGIVEGVSTYKLNPGTYKVTVGPRSTEFTEKQIAGVGQNHYENGKCWHGGVPGYLPSYSFQQVAWNDRYQRNFKDGNPSGISGIATAKGGPPHPGINNAPKQSSDYRPRSGWWPFLFTWYAAGGGQYCGENGITTFYSMNANDTTWKVNGTVDTGNQKESDITGEKAMYGLTPMVIITYDESQAGPVPTTPAPTTPAPTAPPGPSKEEIDRIVREYEAKMAQLRAAAEAEKQALQTQNAAAAEQARQIQEQLVRDLTALKAEYDHMKTAAAATAGQLEDAKRQLDAIKTSYDQKMAALTAAQKAELDALNAKNTAAVNEARAVQQQLISDMTTLKAQYDALVAKAAECPTIPEGAIVVDGKDGQLYKWEMAALRPMSTDTYRSLGSPGYTTFPSGQLDKCPRGPVVVIETPAPTTPVPTSSPSEQKFPNTLYIIVHAESWTEKGELKVLASRFGGATIEPFQYKALEQVFVINNNGYVRNLEGAGPYLASHDDCLAPVMTKETPKTGWKIQKAGDSKYGYRLVSPCGTSLSASVGAREPMLEKATIGVTDVWFVLPVGSAEF